MNEQIFKGEWEQTKGWLKQQWGDLTDDELEKVKGDNQQIYGILQERYGYAKDEVMNQVNDFIKKFIDKADELQGQGNKLMALLSSQISDLSAQIKHLTSRSKQAVCERVQEKPLTSVGIAVSVGVILGYLLGRK